MMKTVAIATVSMAMLALAGCDNKASNSAIDAGNVAASDAATNPLPPAMGAADAASPGQTFADTAAASDAFEIAASNLAVTKASSAAVKAFAKQMIAAHNESTAALEAAAAEASPVIAPNPALTADQQAEIDKLTSASGKAFDTAYVAAQAAAHQAALDTLRGYATSGDVAPLKAFAAKQSPVVAAHLNMAKGLKV